MRFKLASIKGLVCFVLIIIMLTGIMMGGKTHPKAIWYEQPEGFEQIAQNEKMILYADKNSGKISLLNKSTNYIWSSSPSRHEGAKMSAEIVVTYLTKNSPNQQFSTVTVDNYSASVDKNSFEWSLVPDGIKFIFKFPSEGFVIPIQYSLHDEYFKAEILMKEVVAENFFNHNSGVYKNIITSINVLPYFGATTATDDGYMFVPDGPGGLIYFKSRDTYTIPYNQSVYGKEPALSNQNIQDRSLPARIPVFGMKYGDNAFLSIISNSESIAFIEASVSSKSNVYNNIFSGVTLRWYNGSNISQRTANGKNYAVRYYLLSGADANYSGMANKYRQYFAEEKGFIKNNDTDAIALFIDLYGGENIRKSFLGIPIDSVQPLTTYSDCMDILNILKSSGVGNALITYRAWMKGAAKSEIPQKIKFERLLGNRAGFEDLIQCAKNYGILFFPEVNFVDIYKSGNGFTKLFDSVTDLNNLTGYQYAQTKDLKINTQDKWSLLRVDLIKTAISNFINSNDKKLINNLYMGSLANTIASDFTDSGIMRGEAVAYLEQALNNVRSSEKTETILTDWANSYSLPYVDYLANIPVEGNNYQIVDETVPFYQMLVHGYIQYAVPPIHLEQDTEFLFLKAVETGSAISYSGIGREYTPTDRQQTNLTSESYYANWIKALTFNYKRYVDLYNLLYDKIMTSHAQIADNVYETRYEGDVRVIVNYNGSSVFIDGLEIGGKDFIVTKI